MSISKEEYATIVSSFLKEADFQLLPWEFDPDEKQEVIDHFAKKRWSEEQREYAITVASSMFSCMLFYPHGSKNLRVKNGILSCYLTFMDGSIEHFGDSIDNFTINMVTGKAQEHPFLQSFVEFLSDDLGFMSPFIHCAAIQDVHHFVTGCIIERDHSYDFTPDVGAINCAKYMREKTGLGEVYGYWAFSELHPDKEQRKRYMPVMHDVRILVGQANDILSLYKEPIDGIEESTYVGNVAKAQSLTISDALRLVCSEVAQNIKIIRSLLSRPDQEDILKICNGLIDGYMSWHLQLGRYRLDEVPLVDSENKPLKLKRNEPRHKNREIQFVFGV